MWHRSGRPFSYHILYIFEHKHVLTVFYAMEVEIQSNLLDENEKRGGIKSNIQGKVNYLEYKKRKVLETSWD